MTERAAADLSAIPSSPGACVPVAETRSFCVAPWVHLAVGIGGVATPCCEAKGRFGHVKEQSIEEIWHGEPFETFRATLRRDERDERCRKCYDIEDSGGTSIRQIFNAEFAGQAAALLGDADPPARPALPISLDVRFSNLCNFSCRMCWHGSSSKWYSDARKLGWTAAPSALITSFPTTEAGLSALRPLLATVEQIYWAGGEPLLLDEHYAILEELLALGRDDVALSYNSNLSELRPGGFDIVALWARFKSIRLEASIDGVGRHGELIRKGLAWETFVENLLAVKRHCPHIRIVFGITASVFNVFELAEMHRALVALEGCEAQGFRIHVLQEAPFNSIRILPPRLKRKAARRLLAYADTLPATEAGPDGLPSVQRQLRHVVEHMLAEDWQALIPRFRTATERLDRVRGEATAKVCRELAPILRTPLRLRARHGAGGLMRRAAGLLRRLPAG